MIMSDLKKKLVKPAVPTSWTEPTVEQIIGAVQDMHDTLVIRETKTQYICEHARFKKPSQERDGCYVRAVGASRWDEAFTLRITKD